MCSYAPTMMRGLVVLLAMAGCGAPNARGVSPGGGGGGGGDEQPSAPDLGTAPDLAKIACTYPTGPYGVDIGSIPKPTLSWQGYAEGASVVSTIRLQDLYDCNGDQGVRVIVLAQSAQWCGVCKSEASTLEHDMVSQYGPEGVKFIELMIETTSGSPATTTTAKQWHDAYGLDHVAVVADPDFTFAHAGSNSLPVHAIIDPRTMKIVDKPEGSDAIDATIDQLAQKNQ